MCLRCPDNLLDLPLPLILFCLVHQFFRADEAGDEAISGVLHPVVWHLVPLDEKDGVCSRVPPGHSLG